MVRSFLKSFFALLRPATQPLLRGVPSLDYRRRAFMAGTALAVAVLLGLPNAHADNSNNDEWVGTWATRPQIQMPGTTPTEFAANTTLRQIVHTSIGGSTVRVRLSNEIGTQPLVIGAAHVAVRSTGSGIASGSDRTLTFGGRESVTIPPGAPALSDPVPLEVPALSDLPISVYLPNAATGTTFHGVALQTRACSHYSQPISDECEVDESDEHEDEFLEPRED